MLMCLGQYWLGDFKDYIGLLHGEVNGKSLNLIAESAANCFFKNFY